MTGVQTCALPIFVASATPASLAALSNSAKNGILIKGGIHLEKLSELKAIAFDKKDRKSVV